MSASGVNQIIRSNWESYREDLIGAGFETPHDWYTQPQFLERDDYPINDPEDAIWDPLRELPLHVLYRVMGYGDQDLAIVMHNPDVKLKEITSPDTPSHKDELGQLGELEDVDPTKFGEICCPNWSEYMSTGKTGFLNEGNDTWSEKTGHLFRLLESYSTKTHISESQRRSYFQTDGRHPGLFDDFYYTNVFKLPTPTGEGSNSFVGTSIDEKFYEDLTREELRAVRPDVAFVYGKPACDALLTDGTWVDTGHGSPSGGFMKEHGHLYRDETVGTYYVPLVHIGSPNRPRPDVLESTVRHLVEQDAL